MAEALVIVDPEQARPDRPVGTAVAVGPDGADWGSASSREFLTVRVTGASEAELRTTLLGHNDWTAEEGPPDRLRRFVPALLPLVPVGRCSAYLARCRENAAEIATEGRVALRAEYARRMLRGLTAEEQSMKTIDLLRSLDDKPQARDACFAEHHRASRERRLALTADIPQPDVWVVPRAGLLALTEVVRVR